ncbi:hypothetical protein NFI96_029274 [Prochilodus magdalenae]|nr:hypothetical protein NFI96_029274 [Prochilodus magdalenae]
MAVLAPSMVIQQPQTVALVARNANQWNTGICACFDDCDVCCFATWCFPLFACSTASDFGENCCLPLLDGPCLIAGVFCCCIPPISLAMRATVRKQYGIQGGLGSDCLYASFCNTCSWCQISREIKRRRTTFTLVNAQPTVIAPPPMVVASPAPVVAPQTTVVSQSSVTTLVG